MIDDPQAKELAIDNQPMPSFYAARRFCAIPRSITVTSQYQLRPKNIQKAAIIGQFVCYVVLLLQRLRDDISSPHSACS